jgi:hypothetical protein
MSSSLPLTSQSDSLARRLIGDGYAVCRLDDAGSGSVRALYTLSTEYFLQAESVKSRHRVPNLSNGYRPLMSSHSGSPDRPDLSESFLYWRHRREAIPSHEGIASFLDALESYRQTVAEITRCTIDSLRTHYGYAHALPFERASVVQINSFGMDTAEDLLVHPHEDGVLFTVIWASTEGLEGVFEDGPRAFKLAPNEALIMPGSVLTHMTGGQIRPFFHQARNFGHKDRKSFMFFVCPDTDDAIHPFVVNDENRDCDIRSLVINNPQMFGLAGDFLQ